MKVKAGTSDVLRILSIPQGSRIPEEESIGSFNLVNYPVQVVRTTPSFVGTIRSYFSPIITTAQSGIFRKFSFMCGCKFLQGLGACVLLFMTSMGPALALDEKVVIQRPEGSPRAVFKFGFSAYKSGKKEEAVEAYRYAAENGQVGASWKLARMYADGDGVARNDYEAFKFFAAVAQQDVQPGSEDESYIADALFTVGQYLKKGIAGTPIQPSPGLAQEYFMRAAASYRHPSAQFELGRMLLSGEGGTRNITQAARWLQLASEKGHIGAQATLGNLLFQSGQPVRGLALMTAALEHAAPQDAGWIRTAQEQAFAIVGETDRRTAMALSEDYLQNGFR